MKALLLTLSLVAGPADSVSFLVMGKTTNHRQSELRDRVGLKLLNYHFFAEIFARGRGAATDAVLVFPGGATQPFEDKGEVLDLHGGRFDREEALDAAYPAGEYRLRFRTPSGAVERLLRLQESHIPSPPFITLLQDGEPASRVEAAKELTVRWSEVEGAHPDDLLFVVIANCHAERIVHSGRPFEGTSFLTYASRDYRIPGRMLAPGEPHQMFVEIAAVEKSEEEGIPALVTYAATTFLDFETAGTASGRPCPEVMPPFDGGQTDRVRR
jgi:hypothetical protein